MADTTAPSAPSPAPRRKRRWLRILTWLFAVFIVFVVVAYFVGTSSAFFKAFILPRVSAALNATVTVSDASISPFSQVVLRDLKVQTTGSEPLLSASEARLRYSLMDIMRGNIHVEEVTLSSPTVTLVQNPDNTSNLDPLLKGQKEKQPPPAQPAKPSKPLQIDVKKIALTEGTLRQIKIYKTGQRDVTEVQHLNIAVEDVKNGQTGKATLAAEIGVNQTNGVLQAKLAGNFTFALTPDLKPGSIQGSTRLEVTQAKGELAQLAAANLGLDCNVTPTEVKQVSLQFAQGQTRLGQLLVTGPFDTSKSEGRLTLQLLNIDKNLLNLAGAASGVDFGPTTINSTNVIELSKGGNAITASGQFNLNQFQVTRTNQTTPPLDLHASYDVAVDSPANQATLRVFTVSATQKGKEIVKGGLAAPMTLAWGNSANAVGDSSLNLAVTHFDLADWKPFVGDVAPQGAVNMKLQLLSQKAGKQLNFDLSSEIDNLTAGSGSNQITQATVSFQVKGQANDFNQYQVPELKFEVARQNQPLVTASGSANYDQKAETADVQLTAQLLLARLLQLMPRPDMHVSSGTADLKLHITQAPVAGKKPAQAITGTFALTDFTGNVGSNSFRSFGTTADVDVSMTQDIVQIRKFSGKLGEGSSTGGSYDLSGTYRLTNSAAQLTAKLADFNQNGLRPFLEPSLGDKKLVSVALNANASVDYDPAAAAVVKVTLQLTNLVVNDPKGQFPATPLEMKMGVDASYAKQVADVRQCQLGLTPTARATNQLQFTGHIDMTQSNAITGNVKLLADSLDLTSYYDLFGGQPATGASKPATGPGHPQPAPAAPSAAPEQEPPAMQLPLHNFTAETSIGRLYLHEIEITNFQTTTKLDGGHVLLNPFKLALNGAPVNMTLDADLGVPGYKYDLNAGAQALPLAPLVNSFLPDRKGILSGTLTVQAKFAGTGTTGASLQETLTGQFNVNSTNLNLSVDSIQGKSASTRLLKFLVNAIIAIPDLAKNPGGGAASLLGKATGLGGNSGAGDGATASIKKSPINAIIVKGNAGSGRIDLQQALIQSPAFEAVVSGPITLAPVLTNSTIQLPVSISLERSVAQAIRMAGDAAPNATYAKLPDFLTLIGTIGDPKKDINYRVIATTVGSAVLQGAGGNAGKVGSLLQGLGGSTTSTNPPGGQTGNLLRGILGGQTANTNAPATNKPNIGNALDFFRRK